MSSEEQRQKEEAASRRHAKLDNAGVLHMSTQAEVPDKITIVSAPSRLRHASPRYPPRFCRSTRRFRQKALAG